MEEMLADPALTLDVVVLCVPHDLHESLAVKALDHGCFVVLEKPLAVTVPACERILAAARDSML